MTSMSMLKWMTTRITDILVGMITYACPQQCAGEFSFAVGNNQQCPLHNYNYEAHSLLMVDLSQCCTSVDAWTGWKPEKHISTDVRSDCRGIGKAGSRFCSRAYTVSIEGRRNGSPWKQSLISDAISVGINAGSAGSRRPGKQTCLQGEEGNSLNHAPTHGRTLLNELCSLDSIKSSERGLFMIQLHSPPHNSIITANTPPCSLGCFVPPKATLQRQTHPISGRTQTAP